MAYATQDDLVVRFGVEELLQLTDRDRQGVVDAGVIAGWLADADSTIDGYLGTRYATPVTPVPALLTGVACDLARYKLHGNAATENVRTAYTDALKMLRDLADGRAVLAGAAPVSAGAVPAAAPGSARYVAPDRTFGPGALSDFTG